MNRRLALILNYDVPCGIFDRDKFNGTTIVLTTHYLEEAEQLCKKIAIIDEGKIIEDTNMKDLLTKLDSETFIFDLTENLEVAPS